MSKKGRGKMSKPIKQPIAYSTDKLFKTGKYADDNLSYYEIAKMDLAYAEFWANRTDATNPRIPLTFRAAIDRVDEERKAVRSVKHSSPLKITPNQGTATESQEWNVPDYPYPPSTIYSICRRGKYQGQEKTFYDIVLEDREYVDWYLSDESRAASRYGKLFREAVDRVEELLAPRATEEQFMEFYALYPQEYWKEEAKPLFYALSIHKANQLLDFFRDCVRCNWTNITEMPPADGFVRGWDILKRHQTGEKRERKHYATIEEVMFDEE